MSYSFLLLPHVTCLAVSRLDKGAVHSQPSRFCGPLLAFIITFHRKISFSKLDFFKAETRNAIEQRIERERERDRGEREREREVGEREYTSKLIK